MQYLSIFVSGVVLVTDHSLTNIQLEAWNCTDPRPSHSKPPQTQLLKLLNHIKGMRCLTQAQPSIGPNLLNYQLSQKFKLLGYDKFNYLTTQF